MIWPCAIPRRAATSSPPRKATLSATSLLLPSTMRGWTTGSATRASTPRCSGPVDASALVGDSTLARTVLGWRPTRSFADPVGAMVDVDLAGLGGTSTT